MLLYFYPADFTPICTAQACAFRDRQDVISSASLKIVGVSPQSEGSHQRFADTYDLGFPLIPDQDKRIIKAYDVRGLVPEQLDAELWCGDGAGLRGLERVAEIVRNEFDVPWVRVKINKPGAIRGSRDVGVIIERGVRA